MPVRLLLLIAGTAVSLAAQGPFNRELLGFPPRDSTTACKLRQTDPVPPGATEAHWFWIGLAVPTVRTGGGQVLASSPPPRQIWVSYDRAGRPVLLADSVSDAAGHTVAQVRFGPGTNASGFRQRAELDSALARQLMNSSAKLTVMEVADSLTRAMKRSPPAALDAATLRRAREIADFLWTRRCISSVRS
jgi:hypothetical protein